MIRYAQTQAVILLMTLWCVLHACQAPAQSKGKPQKETKSTEKTFKSVVTGAEQMDAYLPKLNGKQVALMVNHTSVINQTHLVDSLIAVGVKVKMIFAPEHGFRGTADAGDHIENGKDPKTGLPIISLYGDKLKPSAEDLKGVDIVMFDIQDVGVRFYTYISSMHYLMEACAENHLPLIILDRPNPNIHRIDGPVLRKPFQSFVGMHPIPILHGLTVGELAQMIVGQKWLSENLSPELEVIACKNYTRNTRYSLPIKPSPNLPNDRAVYLYPSICLFEGTDISVARGTDFPFQAIGSPNLKSGPFEFTPKSVPGAKNPPHLGNVCKGYDLRMEISEFGKEDDGLNLQYLFKMYSLHKNPNEFFLKNNFFNKLAGNSTLKTQIETELSEQAIRASWSRELENYKLMRKPYLLYE